MRFVSVGIQNKICPWTLISLSPVQLGPPRLGGVTPSPFSLNLVVLRPLGTQCFSHIAPLTLQVFYQKQGPQEQPQASHQLTSLELPCLSNSCPLSLSSPRHRLQPYSTYSLAIRTQTQATLRTNTWSPWLNITAQTLPTGRDRHQREIVILSACLVPAPLSSSSVFFHMTDLLNGSSLLTLHWQPVREEDRHGPAFR